jgi:hypothetical protein
MLKNVATGVIFLGFALSLPACMAGTDAAGTDTAGEDVGQASAALEFFGQEVVEGGSNAGVQYTNNLSGLGALLALLDWGMPLEVDDYCANSLPGGLCTPTTRAPHPTLVRFKYAYSLPDGSEASWGPYHWTANATVSQAFEGQLGNPNGQAISCRKVLSSGTWACSTGTGGPGFSAYINGIYR